MHNSTCLVVLLLRTAVESRRLIGHSGPVFSTSFNTDNSFLLSSSADRTGMDRIHKWWPRNYPFVFVLFILTSSLWSTNSFEFVRANNASEDDLQHKIIT